MTKTRSGGRTPAAKSSRRRQTSDSLRTAGSSPDAPPSMEPRIDMQEPHISLTYMNVSNNIPDQSDHIQGERPPKLHQSIPSEDPPTRISDSTKTARQKAIDDFDATELALAKGRESTQAWKRALKPTSEDKATVPQLKESLARRFPGLFDGPKVH